MTLIEKDIQFLEEMKSTLELAREKNDWSRYDHLEKMIDDWLDELNGKLKRNDNRGYYSENVSGVQT